MAEEVYLLGVGMTRFGKYLEKSIKDLTGEALNYALQDANVERRDLEAAWFSNSAWGIYKFQHCIRGQVALSANGVEGIPIINVENACAGGSTALHSAWMAVQSGYDCILAIGAEKLYDENRSMVMRSFSSAIDVEEMMKSIEQYQAAQKKQQEEKAAAEGAGQKQEEKAGGHSVFMDFYAGMARRHMKKYGTTQRQLAVITAKAHNNSCLNPLAQYTFPLTVEEALNDRVVSFPLTRSMCAPIGDGAAAAVVCSGRFLKAHPSSRAVRIRASVLKSGTRGGQNDIGFRASRQAYENAGLGPGDIDVAEVHDATAFGELIQSEELGFCKEGEGGPFAESGATALDGRLPINPSGGLISRGHPIGASGLAQIYELVTQLRGEAGKRQVSRHRIALTENGGGTIGGGEAAMTIHIIEKTEL